jgi:hypothetical protein
MFPRHARVPLGENVPVLHGRFETVAFEQEAGGVIARLAQRAGDDDRRAVSDHLPRLFIVAGLLRPTVRAPAISSPERGR